MEIRKKKVQFTSIHSGLLISFALYETNVMATERHEVTTKEGDVTT